MITAGLEVDLCLIDINLGPGMTGVEVLQRIQQEELLDEVAPAPRDLPLRLAPPRSASLRAAAGTSSAPPHAPRAAA